MPPPPVIPTPIVVDPVVVAKFVTKLEKDTAGLGTFKEKLARVLSIDPAAYTEEDIAQVPACDVTMRIVRSHMLLSTKGQ